MLGGEIYKGERDEEDAMSRCVEGYRVELKLMEE